MSRYRSEREQRELAVKAAKKALGLGDQLKFTCPKCAHDRVMGGLSHGLMQCRLCGFKAVPSSFKLEKRPSLKWDEVLEVWPDKEEVVMPKFKVTIMEAAFYVIEVETDDEDAVEALAEEVFVQAEDTDNFFSHVGQRYAINVEEVKMMNLYFISTPKIGDDMNLDLLVGANDPDEAVVLWVAYYQLPPRTWPDQVFLVPMPTEAKALRWHTDLIAQVVREQCVSMATTALGLREGDGDAEC